MTNPTLKSPLIALSERVYRALLILYPADYRSEYGLSMVQVFRDVCRETYRDQGLAGIALWWCSTLLDLTLTAFEQRRKVRFAMSKSTLIQLTGILLILGGICGAFAAVSQLQPSSHYTYYGIYQFALFLLAPCYLLIGIGSFGLALRYLDNLSRGGRRALIISGIGALLMMLGLAFSQIYPASAVTWLLLLAGFLVYTAGTLAFGLIHLWTPILPVFKALPLITGLGPLLLLFSVFRTDVNNTDLGAFALLIIFAAAWAMIGLAVQRSQPTAATA